MLGRGKMLSADRTESEAAASRPPPPLRSPADVTRDRITDEVRDLAGEKPADFAKLVKLWLHPD